MQVIYENKEFRNGIRIGSSEVTTGNKYKQFTNSLDTLWNKNVYPNWPVYSFSYPAYEYPSSYPITAPIQIQYPLVSGTLATQEWIQSKIYKDTDGYLHIDF